MSRRAFNPWRGLGGLPAEVWIVFATTLVNRVGTMALPLLALYLAEHLHYPATIAGLAITVYGAGSLVSAPIAGRLSDTYGGLRVMRAALIASGVMLFLVPLVSSATAVFAVIFCWALAAESLRPASLATLTGSASSSQRKAAIALNRLAINLGMSVGPAAGSLLATLSFPLLFIVDGATSILAGCVLTLLIARSGMQVAPTIVQAGRAGAAGSVFRDRKLLLFLISLYLYYAAFLQLEAAFPLFLVRDLDLPVSFFGLTFVINTVLIILFEVPLNLKMQNWGNRWPLIAGSALNAIGFGGLILARDPWSIAALAVVWTAGEMIFLPGAATYVAGLAPPERRGVYIGAYASTFSVALLTAPWAGSVVLEHFGPMALWTSILALGLAGTALLWRSVDS